jgi:hypothetical protein
MQESATAQLSRRTRDRELGRHSTQSNDTSRGTDLGDLVATGNGSRHRRFREFSTNDHLFGCQLYIHARACTASQAFPGPYAH